MTENELAKIVADSALRVHRTLGPGPLESVYEEILSHEPMKRNIQMERQKPIEVIYEGVRMEIGYRVDILVCNKLIVEVKSTEAIAPVHHKQLLTYLRLKNIR